MTNSRYFFLNDSLTSIRGCWEKGQLDRGERLKIKIINKNNRLNDIHDY